MLGSTSRALAMPTTALRSRGLATDNSPRKIVLVGAGFLASYIARALIADPRNRVLLVSRNPKPSTSSPLVYSYLSLDILPSTSRASTLPAFALTSSVRQTIPLRFPNPPTPISRYYRCVLIEPSLERCERSSILSGCTSWKCQSHGESTEGRSGECS